MPDGIRGARVLAAGAESQAPGRSEHEQIGGDHEPEAEPDHQVELAEYLREEVAAVRDRDVGDLLARRQRRRAVRAVDLDEQVAGQSEREEVDRRSADDLVRAQVDGPDRVDEREQAAGDHGDQHAGDPRARLVGAPDAEEGAGEHHPLEPDVHDAAPLREHAAERGIGQRSGVPERGTEQRPPGERGLEVRHAGVLEEQAEPEADRARGNRSPADAALVPRDRVAAAGDRNDAEHDRHRGRTRVRRRQAQPAAEDADEDAGERDVPRAEHALLGQAFAELDGAHWYGAAFRPRPLTTFLVLSQLAITSRSAPTKRTTRPWMISVRLLASSGSNTEGSSWRVEVPRIAHRTGARRTSSPAPCSGPGERRQCR